MPVGTPLTARDNMYGIVCCSQNDTYELGMLSLGKKSTICIHMH